MFDYDKWQEIFATIKKNKLRTFLTMFGVFWGIFMLMLLLGSGTGLENGVVKGFDGWATNSGFVWGQRTTMPYKGLKPGRNTRFNNDDVAAIKSSVPELGALAPRNQLGGFGGGNNVFRNSKSGAFSVSGDNPEYMAVMKLNFTSGRFINQLDMEDKRKVTVIGKKVVEILFTPEEDPIGQYIQINGIYFKIVGVFASKRTGQQADGDNQTIYIPNSTFQQVFNWGNRVGWFAFTSKPGVPVSVVEEKIKKVLMERHRIHPEDMVALGSENLEKEFGEINGLFAGINIFVWIVGIGTLIAGVIGVSNIMLIIVKERTKEIGIRKSLGATPRSIVSLIIQESIFITALAGYVGLILGIGLIELISYLLSSSGADTGMFSNPTIDINVAISSFIILIFAGALAGLIPATKAASISPIEAIRSE